MLSVQHWEELVGLGLESRLVGVGSCSARTWSSNRSRIEACSAKGLARDMEFTYRSPARSTEPQRVLKNAASLIVGALPYPPPVEFLETADMAPTGRVAAYATDVHYQHLREILGAISNRLKEFGYRATVVLDSNAVLDKEAAYRAGLGWYGRNSLLLNRHVGSWCVLGSVVTDALIPQLSVPVPDGCGGCRRCVPACPTGALAGDGTVDANKCLSWLLQARGEFPPEFREALGTRMYGCDDCQVACPPSTVSIRRGHLGAPLLIEPLSLIDILDMSDDQLLTQFGDWYIADRDPDLIRRNALIGLGNSASEAQEIPVTLHRYRNGPDALLAEHARWAIEQRRSRGSA